MNWSRRAFLRTGSLAVVGGIFVPKYERWFRPLVVTHSPEDLFVALYQTGSQGSYARQAVRFSRMDGGVANANEIAFPPVGQALTVDQIRLEDRQGRVLWWQNPDGVPTPLQPGDQVRIFSGSLQVASDEWEYVRPIPPLRPPRRDLFSSLIQRV